MMENTLEKPYLPSGEYSDHYATQPARVPALKRRRARRNSLLNRMVAVPVAAAVLGLMSLNPFKIAEDSEEN